LLLFKPERIATPGGNRWGAVGFPPGELREIAGIGVVRLKGNGHATFF